jgi:hypothetical protein
MEHDYPWNTNTHGTQSRYHANAPHRRPDQMEPMVRNAFNAALLAATPILCEPVFAVEIQVPADRIKPVHLSAAARFFCLHFWGICSVFFWTETCYFYTCRPRDHTALFIKQGLLSIRICSSRFSTCASHVLSTCALHVLLRVPQRNHFHCDLASIVDADCTVRPLQRVIHTLLKRFATVRSRRPKEARNGCE